MLKRYGSLVVLSLLCVLVASSLAYAGTISGTVYKASGGALTGDDVELWAVQGDPCNNTERYGLTWTNTDNGTYSITDLTAGEYYVRTSNMNLSNYMDEWWANSGSDRDCANAGLLTVTESGTTQADFQLDLGGRIAGVVYQGSSSTPVTGVEIELWALQGDPLQSNDAVRTRLERYWRWELCFLGSAGWRLLR